MSGSFSDQSDLIADLASLKHKINDHSDTLSFEKDKFFKSIERNGVQHYNFAFDALAAALLSSNVVFFIFMDHSHVESIMAYLVLPLCVLVFTQALKYAVRQWPSLMPYLPFIINIFGITMMAEKII